MPDDHIQEAAEAALSAFRREDQRLAPGGGALDSELVTAAVDAAKPHFARYYEDKGAEKVKRVEEERDNALSELAHLAEETGWEPGQQREGGLPGEQASPVDHALQQFVFLGQELAAAEDKGRSEERARIAYRLREELIAVEREAAEADDLTARTVRVVKAEGVRLALRAIDSDQADTEEEK